MARSRLRRVGPLVAVEGTAPELEALSEERSTRLATRAPPTFRPASSARPPTVSSPLLPRGQPGRCIQLGHPSLHGQSRSNVAAFASSDSSTWYAFSDRPMPPSAKSYT